MTRPDALALADRCRGGDAPALDALLWVALPVAVRVAKTNVPARLPAYLDAEDLLSVAREAAWRCCAEYAEHVDGEFEDYVAVAARNAVVDELRKATTEKRNPGPTLNGPRAERAAQTVADTAPNLYEAAVFAELRECVDELPGVEREVLTRRYLRGETLKQIGKALGFSHQAAAKHCDRAVARLRGVYVPDND